jgi:acetyl-CoA acetyltransferase
VGARAARSAFAAAGLAPADVDVAELYDPFSFEIIRQLEAFGFCAAGEGGPFVEDGKLRVGGALPTNTDGGGLSSCQPGMRGIFLLIEAVKQLRGECGARQVADAELACVNGTSGWFTAASTAILGRG